MKKVFLSLFVAGALAFGLQSCGEDDDTTTPPVATCEVCGTYTGNFNTGGDSATILIAPNVGLDNEVLEDTPFSAVVTAVAGQADSLQVTATLQVTVANNPVPVPVTLRVGYNSTANTFAAPANQNINITAAGIPIAVKLVAFSGTFSGTNSMAGTIVLDDQDGSANDNIDATFFVSGTK